MMAFLCKKEHLIPYFTFRFGKAPEIGGAVAFLASSDASYMTGESMVVGGGMATRL